MSTNNDEINVKVKADTSGLGPGMAGAQSTVARAAAAMRGQFATLRAETASVMRSMADEVGNTMRGVAGSFGGLVDVLATSKVGLIALAGAAGLLAGSKAVSATADMTESAMDLGRALGLTTNQASIYRAAMEDLGAPVSELEGAAKGLSRNLRENEADMNKLGLKTRDAAGNFRPMNELVLDGIEVLNGYKEGADRNVASQVLFGRGIDASSKLLLLNKQVVAENAEAVRELGLEVGANSVAAWKDFDAATDRAGLSVRGMVKAIGDSLMPVLTDVVRMFNAVMPAAIVVVRGALSGLTSAFLLVKNGIVVMWEVGLAALKSLGTSISIVLEALGRVMLGDFSGAMNVMRAGTASMEGYWSGAMDRMAESSAETAAKVAALFSEDTAAGGTGGRTGTKTAPDLGGGAKGGAKGGGKETASYMAYYEATLEEARRAATELDAIHGLSKQDELQYWQDLLSYAQLTEADKVAVSRKAAALRIIILQEEARQAQQIAQIGVQSWRERELAGVELEAQAARNRLDLGQITQQQLLEMEQGFEQRRFEIRTAALRASLATLDPARDPVQVAQINAQIEGLELQHQQRMAQLRGQVAVESSAQYRAIWEDAISRINGLWDKGVNAMMQGTLTWRNAFKAIGTEIVGWFANAVVGNMVKEWLLAQSRKLQASITGWMAEKAAAVSGAATTVAAKTGEATAVVSANAAEAASGAAASQAPIPIVGPGLAAAAFASIGALVMGALGMMKSAAGGYDIPAGINPLTQLHAREMVLPAKYADVIRGMAGGGGAGGVTSVTMNITTPDADSFRASGDRITGELQQRLGALRRGI